MKVLKSIVLVVGQLGNGGLERQLAFLIPALQNRGVLVRCVVWNFEEDDAYTNSMKAILGEDLIGLETTQGSFSKLIALRKLLKKFKPDLALSFSTYINLPVYASSLGICKSIGSLRTSASLYVQTGGVKAKLNLKYPPKILANSERAIAELHQIYPKVESAYLQNVIDVRKFNKESGEKRHFKSSVSVGNVRTVKRLDRMLEVFKNLKEQGYNVKHTHVGGGKGLEDLKTKAVEMNLQDTISFIGQSSTIHKHLREHQIFVHFAEYEGSPNVIMEAMAAGLAIVTTDCGDVTSYVKDGYNGYVISPYETNDFVKKYKELLDNPEKRERMSISGKAIIEASDIAEIDKFFVTALKGLGLEYKYPG
ncbi:glycosyltransferase family 4 protein [Owenweeksia hongkongensis]|uniref:glycosyltransferase family 4 protein n=1 Tax=Owenweeksia hongkongensis TaxID=253245 RepID=UPI003A956E1C